MGTREGFTHSDDRPARDRVALFLLNQRNDYQAELLRGALQAARRCRLDIEVHDAARDSDRQIQQVTAAVRSQDRGRLLALLVHPVFDASFEKLAKEATSEGVGWVLLNRTPSYLDQLRSLHPRLPVFTVGPDQQEIGRAQGEVVRALLPRGGKVLYIVGPFWAPSARLRRTGLEKAIAGAGIELVQTYGDWSRDSGEHALGRWEVLERESGIPDLIVAQNDAMAAGASKALSEVARRRQWPRLARVPVVGSDGTRDFGVRLVAEGTLVATVAVPDTGAPAIHALDDWQRGRPCPANLVLPVSPHPALASLPPIASRR
jgi:ABC-type sugar transport system substrate-binding protein